MTSRDEAASAVAAEWVAARLGPGSALVMGDPRTELARALEDAGRTVTRWHRHVTADQRCGPWPPDGVYDEAWVRMPRSGLEAAMLLHAAAVRVPDGRPVHLYGAKDEGIRSAHKHLPAGTGEPDTVLTKRRCRVLRAVRVAPPPLPDGLAAWTVTGSVDWGAGAREWVFYPGVFACGRLDPATALLIRALPALPPGGRLLDFGAGTGLIAAAALEAWDVASADLLEPDSIALEAARVNVPGARRILASGLEEADGPYDLIVSNPPIHRGKDQSLSTLDALIAGAGGRLAPGGRLLLVVQRRLAMERKLRRSFEDVAQVADQDGFRVWRATRPRERSDRRLP